MGLQTVTAALLADLWAGFAGGSLQPYVSESMAVLLPAQAEAVAMSDAYLAAYVGSELAMDVAPVGVDAATVIGVTRKGVPLGNVVASAARSVLEPAKAVPAVGATEVAEAGRMGLRAAMASTSVVVGWRRVMSGGCGACLAATTGAIHPVGDMPLVHPRCGCHAEPVVRDVPDTVRRPTGEEMFNGLPEPDQDALLGAEKASMVRSGDIRFSELEQRVPEFGWITERPLDALQS